MTRWSACWIWAPSILFALLVAAGLFYLALWPRFTVGVVTDDAYALLAATSIAHGRYAVEYEPGKPPLTDLLPGYPILLAPFIRFIRPHWDRLKWLPILFTLSAGWLLSRLTLRPLGLAASLFLVWLFSFNPTTVDLSGMLLSDSCFLFFVVLDAWVFRRLLERPSVRGSVCLGIFLTATALIRPQGALVALAMAFTLAFFRRYRTSALLGGIGVSLWVTVMVDYWLRRQGGTGYWSLWRAHMALPYLDSPLVWRNVTAIFRIFLRVNLLGMPFSALSPPYQAFAWILSLITLAVLTVGARLWSTLDGPDGPLAVTAIIFSLMYLSLSMLWPVGQPRYFHPLMPLAMTASITGAQYIWRRRPLLRPVLVIFGLGMIIFYMRGDAAALGEVQEPREASPITSQTYDWIGMHTPPTALLLARQIPVAYLYTARQGFAGLEARSPEAFRYSLLTKKINYVVQTSPFILRGSHDAYLWEHAASWMENYPTGFKRVYINPAERTALYQVIDDRAFTQAYRLYLSALQDLNRYPHSPKAEQQLEQSLVLDPNLASALNAYGTALLIKGDVSHAKQFLLQAVRTQPLYPLAWLNLARVYKRQHNPEAALESLKKALEMTQTSGEDLMLMTTIRAEMQRP